MNLASMDGKMTHLHSDMSAVEKSIYGHRFPNKDEIFRLDLIKSYQKKLPEMKRYDGSLPIAEKIQKWDPKLEKRYRMQTDRIDNLKS